MAGECGGSEDKKEGVFSNPRRYSRSPTLCRLPSPPQPSLCFPLWASCSSAAKRGVGVARSPSLFPQSPVLTRWTPGRGTGTVGRSLSADYSLLLTFIYSGHVVGEAQVQSLDCRLVAEPSGSQCGMEQVVFPKPGPQEPTQRLLSQLERGVLVASNARGLFVQRLCPIPVSWSAPQTPPGPGPHLLPSNECVELFRTTYFCRGEAAAAQRPSPYPHLLVPRPCPYPVLPPTEPPSQPMHGTRHLLCAHPAGSCAEPSSRHPGCGR